MSFLGTIGAVLERTEVRNLPGQGFDIFQEYSGRIDTIFSVADTLSQDGWEVEVIGTGAVRRLLAHRQSFPSESATEFHDRFTVKKEPVQKSIWSLDKVQEEIELYATNTGTNGIGYVKAIEEALEDPEGSPLSGALGIGTYPNAFDVLTELARGADSFEDEYIVLSRDRVVATDFSNKLTRKNATQIYSNAALISQFNLPLFTQFLLPVTPSFTPSNTVWGWRSRRHEVGYESDSNKAHIVQDWAFAAWSTNLYAVFG